MDFEKSVKELEIIIDKLNQGDLPLEESIDLYEKGIKLTKQLEKALDANQKRVSIILEGKEQPFDNTIQDEKTKQMTIGDAIE